MLLTLSACDQQTFNNPYPKEQQEANILYTSFNESPKTLDPARAYNVNESLFIAQIYEPPLQYHYLKRPYQLEPLTASEMPKVTYLDKYKKPLPDNASDQAIAYSVYTIHIKPDIYYQPHPAFAKNQQGKYYYHALTKKFLDKQHITSLADFPFTASRELTAADYVYQIKRFAHPKVQSPILGLMSEHILGLADYAKILHDVYEQQVARQDKHTFLDLRKHDFAGVQELDRYTYQIALQGKYPQFMYWLSMPFFSPIPWEADRFSSQAGMASRNLTLDWHPVGTGPYVLIENNPNRRMVLHKNPHYHAEFHPGFDQNNMQQRLPLIERAIFNLEKESIPRWNKFLQGYYDQSAIGTDSSEQTIQMDEYGDVQLTDGMKKRGLQLQSDVGPSIFFMGFNMLDKVVGGRSERARKLRQAIAIAVDYEEFIKLFLNGRGIVAQSPIPPGIFGYQEGEAGINPYIYEWRGQHAERHSLTKAKQLLREAGYPNGRDATTGEPLMINYDITLTNGPDEKARYAWLRRQFAKLGLQLNIRATQYNRFQEKMRNGNAQVFFWGWLADYPDPENFLFLLYGPNSKVHHGGENAANYSNEEFDRLFIKMRNLPNGDERLAVIQQMLNIIQRDTPWIWGIHPKQFVLSHQWMQHNIPHGFASNNLKYKAIDSTLRVAKRQQWNKPLLWPIKLFVAGLLFSLLLVLYYVWRRGRRAIISSRPRSKKL